jgi:hypothetical protein
MLQFILHRKRTPLRLQLCPAPHRSAQTSNLRVLSNGGCHESAFKAPSPPRRIHRWSILSVRDATGPLRRGSWIEHSVLACPYAS